MSVCQRLGMSLPDIESEISQLIQNRGDGVLLPGQGFFLEKQDELEICRNCRCVVHQKTKKEATRPKCLITTVKALLSGFSATALALLPCVFNTSTVRVRACIINGSQETRLSQALSKYMERFLDIAVEWTPGFMEPKNFWVYLSHLRALLHDESNALDLPHDVLAFSAKDTTVAVRALLEDEAFSVSGQYLAIYSGRLSSKGCVREIVVEGRDNAVSGRQKLTKPYTLATGCLFRPTNANSCRSLNSLCNVDVKLDIFEARFYLVPIGNDLITSTTSETYPRQDLIPLNIIGSIHNLLGSIISSSCGHPKETPLLIPKDSEFELFEAGIDSVLPPSRASCLFLSAHGVRSWQLIAYNSESFHRSRIAVLQGDSCLPCAFLVAQRAVHRHEELRNDTLSKLSGLSKARFGATVICS